MAITCAPAWAASCTAWLPTPPVAPTTRTLWPGSSSAASTAACAAAPASPSAGGLDEVDRLGKAREADRGRHGHVLTEGAVAEVRLCDDAEHAVAGPVAVDVGAYCVDHPREVLADDHGEAVLHHVLQVAAGDRQVEAVDGGGVDAHAYLPVGGLGDVEVHEFGCGFKVGEGVGLPTIRG